MIHENIFIIGIITLAILIIALLSVIGGRVLNELIKSREILLAIAQRLVEGEEEDEGSPEDLPAPSNPLKIIPKNPRMSPGLLNNPEEEDLFYVV